MRVIYKYPILAKGDFKIHEISMPKEAQIITVHTRGHYIVFWAIVNPDNELENRRFALWGTGHALPEKFTYIGTSLRENHPFHLIEIS